MIHSEVSNCKYFDPCRKLTTNGFLTPFIETFYTPRYLERMANSTEFIHFCLTLCSHDTETIELLLNSSSRKNIDRGSPRRGRLHVSPSQPEVSSPNLNLLWAGTRMDREAGSTGREMASPLR
ncbi:hypothetical protein PsorP6_014537 [Peronosclerospora sorghi]|uniref:Uncharacterized protein n=1 Tax=Peronosclerospora sorghi TaxID=230839 RepID=A0ACC0VR11_9STRA|nr:hypothetical protein PsorP6_014537 [Peronosclerospora sorghi]